MDPTRRKHTNGGIPLPAESPHAPIAAADVGRIPIVQIPPQTAEFVLARLHQQVDLARHLVHHPLPIAVHVPLRVACAQHRHLGLQQQRHRLLPLVRAGRMAQAGVKEHEAVEVRVEGLEESGLVESVVVVHVGAHLHLEADPPFDHGSERIVRCPGRHRVLLFPVHHAFGPDEDDVEEHAREQVGELEPDIARERRFRPRAEDEDPHGRGTAAQPFDVRTASRFHGMKKIA